MDVDNESDNEIQNELLIDVEKSFNNIISKFGISFTKTDCIDHNLFSSIAVYLEHNNFRYYKSLYC